MRFSTSALSVRPTGNVNPWATTSPNITGRSARRASDRARPERCCNSATMRSRASLFGFHRRSRPFARTRYAPSLPGVGSEPDMEVQGLQRAAVIARRGAGDAEIVPGGGVRGGLLRTLLGGARGVAELARGAREGAVPGGPA